MRVIFSSVLLFAVLGCEVEHRVGQPPESPSVNQTTPQIVEMTGTGKAELPKPEKPSHWMRIVLNHEFKLNDQCLFARDRAERFAQANKIEVAYNVWKPMYAEMGIKEAPCIYVENAKGEIVGKLYGVPLPEEMERFWEKVTGKKPKSVEE